MTDKEEKELVKTKVGNAFDSLTKAQFAGTRQYGEDFDCVLKLVGNLLLKIEEEE